MSRNESSEDQAIEDGYNLRDGCSRFVHKSHVALFKQILEGELDENVFHYWLQLQTSLTEEFSKQQVGHVSIIIPPNNEHSCLSSLSYHAYPLYY